MAKKKNENVMEQVNSLLDISDSYAAPVKILEILLQDNEQTEKIFHKFLKLFDYNLSYDWFFRYFQDEHADRKNKKQDFTPDTLSSLTSEILNTENGIIFEPTAGTGGMIIKDWDKRMKKALPWTFDTMSVWYIAEELSEKTIPFLLFNLAIRGINGNVIHCNGLSREAFAAYEVRNEKNNPMGFSHVYKLPQNTMCEDIFNIKFKED